MVQYGQYRSSNLPTVGEWFPPTENERTKEVKKTEEVPRGDEEYNN